MMRSYTLYVGLLLLTLRNPARAQKFETFSAGFVKGYRQLHIPSLELSYIDNLRHIKNADSIRLQKSFFNNTMAGLKQFDYKKLNASQQQDYQQIAYESVLNLERLKLEHEMSTQDLQHLSADGIRNIPDGKAWYRYFMKKWLSDNVTPDQVYQFGLQEVEQVNAHIEVIRKQTGQSEEAFYKHLNGPEFFVSDSNVIRHRFEEMKAIVYKNLHRVFNQHTIPPLHIARGTAPALVQTPGYYSENTFYYNLFDKPYNVRQFDWLFIHEAVPGHHYQSSIAAAVPKSAVQQQFYYLGLAEGWGAYAEYLGKEVGLYRTIYDELGKWEWDIVRSVRVPLDVGINYYGWTDEQALAFWKQHVHNQDDIAMREINRVKRWPVQAITYKYGAAQILKWREALQRKQGKGFDIRAFHDSILNRGSLPIYILKGYIIKSG